MLTIQILHRSQGHSTYHQAKKIAKNLETREDKHRRYYQKKLASNNFFCYKGKENKKIIFINVTKMFQVTRRKQWAVHEKRNMKMHLNKHKCNAP